MKNLTVAFVTARVKHRFDWFFDSLMNQVKGDCPSLLMIDAVGTAEFHDVYRCRPKPNIWQGEHRVTQEDWWAKSNALNTAICLCRTDWIAFVDDRCVLEPMWLESVRDAMAGNYALCGAYEKRQNLIVEAGKIIESDSGDGLDIRSPRGMDHREKGIGFGPVQAPGSWWFGCSTVMPVEWALQVNGYEELCDGMGHEDCVFGLMLENNGFPIRYDRRMKVIQDRTPSEIGEPMKRSSKERYPHDKMDKAHLALKRFGGVKRANQSFNLREIREKVLHGEPFPLPTSGPHLDWFDSQDITTMI